MDGCKHCGRKPVYKDGYCRPCWLRVEKYGSPESTTITANELLELMRDYEVPCGYEALVGYIEANKLVDADGRPFALSTRNPDTGHRSFIIFRRPAVRWLEEMTR